MNYRLIFTALLVASGAVVAQTTACKGIFNECFDGIDNDGDGVVDSEDPACSGWQSKRLQVANLSCATETNNRGLHMSNPVCERISATQSRLGVSEGDDPMCFDGKDNDNDGAIDLDDPGCFDKFDNDEANPECSDGIDNDKDGDIDLADIGCKRDPRGTNEAYKPICSDGIDNDGDGKTDFPSDVGCGNSLDTSELNPQCSDGIDNNGNGKIDYPFDASCRAAYDTSEGYNACDDGIDNDADGLIDSADPECEPVWSSSEHTKGNCNDGIDNDGDGLIDMTDVDKNHLGDPACTSKTSFEHLDPVCADRQDNDGDGRADFAGVDNNSDGQFDGPGEFPPDPGCLTATHKTESPKPACADGIDNDGDGTADYNGVDTNGDGTRDMPPDVACTGTTDADRMRDLNEGAPTQCADGIDNDKDGRIDWEAEFTIYSNTPNPKYTNRDPECDDIFDNDESK